MILQFCGLSGSGKSTLALKTKAYFQKEGIFIEVIDGDEYRKHICQDLGYTKTDRNTNIRRLAFLAGKFSSFNIIPIICAINPYEEIRKEVGQNYPEVKTIFIKCSMAELVSRDTKGLYSRSRLQENHPDKIKNLTGVNDPFEEPILPDLTIETDKESIEESLNKLTEYIKKNR